MNFVPERMLHTVALCILLFGQGCGKSSNPGDIQPLSPGAQALLEDTWHPWWHGTSLCFTVHAPSEEMLTAAANEADFAWRYLQQLLPADAGFQGQLFILARPTLWKLVVETNRLRPDRSAARLGDEIYIFTERDTPWREDAIPHEVVHWYFGHAGLGHLPLGIEEGLATGLGREITRLMLQERGRSLVIEREALAPESLIPWDNFFSLETYPLDADQARVFYRQSEALASRLFHIGNAFNPDVFLEWAGAQQELTRAGLESYLDSQGVDASSFYREVEAETIKGWPL